jgi:murein DD-endopeptidase MepM/ murein hydrolase activator NlpD
LAAVRAVCLGVAFFLGAQYAHAQLPADGGGELLHEHRDIASAEIDAILPRVVARARELGVEPPDGTPVPLIDRATAVKLIHPLRLRRHSFRRQANGVSNYVDHDPTAGILDHACNSRSYDGHRGIDYSFGAFSWRTMDAAEVEIVAAAPGTIIEKVDGQYDRQCNWTSAPANYVIVRHADGVYAFYWHMKNGSVTTKAVGAAVQRGEYLGLVGSSGNSNGPHLHFELRDVRNDGNTKADPYAGLCTVPASNVTLWKHQHETDDTSIIRAATHTSQPPSITYPFPAPNFCGTDGLPINPNPGWGDSFAPGATAYLAVYLKDQRADTPVTMQLFKPDGTLYSTGGPAGPGAGSFFRFSYWWWSRTLPTDSPGMWRVRFTMNGRSAEHAFYVGTAPTAATSVLARVEPQVRSPRTEIDAPVNVYVKNTGTRTAQGCWVDADYPIAATLTTQLLSPSGQPVGLPDQVFSVAPGATQRVRATLRGKAGYTATGIEIPIRAKCLNADSSVVKTGLNTLWASFQATRVVDIVTTIATPGASGIVQMASTASTTAVVLSTKNVGAAGTVRIRPYSTNPAAPITALAVCEMNASNVCINAYATSYVRSFAFGEQVRWRLRIRTTGAVPLDELATRVIVEAVQEPGGHLRGQSSVAVKTP